MQSFLAISLGILMLTWVTNLRPFRNATAALALAFLSACPSGSESSQSQFNPTPTHTPSASPTLPQPDPASSTATEDSTNVMEFHTRYTRDRTFNGRFIIERFRTTRTDPAALNTLRLFENSRALFTVDEESLGTGVIFDFQFSPQADPTTIACSLRVEFDGYFCCNDMLRLTLVSRDRYLENPIGCVQQIVGAPAAQVSADLKNALIESSTSATPMIYHFMHSPSRDRVRLQNPAPIDRRHTVPAETELIITGT